MSFGVTSPASLSKHEMTLHLPLLIDFSWVSGKCYVKMAEICSWIIRERKDWFKLRQSESLKSCAFLRLSVPNPRSHLVKLKDYMVTALII